jgi:hypothetical protein
LCNRWRAWKSDPPLKIDPEWLEVRGAKIDMALEDLDLRMIMDVRLIPAVEVDLRTVMDDRPTAKEVCPETSPLREQCRLNSLKVIQTNAEVPQGHLDKMATRNLGITREGMVPYHHCATTSLLLRGA